MKIQLKHSNVLDGSSAKKPTADQMEYGELAVNYNNNDPSVFIKDSTNKVVRIAGKNALNGINLPDEGGVNHQPNTLDDRYVEVVGDNMTGNLTLGTNKIVLNSTSGSAEFTGNVTLPGGGGDTQALQKQEVVSLISAIPAPDFSPYVVKSGDTMTGNLTLPGGGSDTQALQKQEIVSLISAIPEPDLSPYVFKSGDNMTGNLTLGTNQITLGAQDGAGTFVGNVTANSFIGDGSNLTGIVAEIGDLPVASTSVAGIVQLEDSVVSTSDTTAATPNAAKTAYDRGSLGVTNAATAQQAADAAQSTANTGVANSATAQQAADGAQSTANAALPKTGGTISSDLTVNGTFQAGHFNLSNLTELA